MKKLLYIIFSGIGFFSISRLEAENVPHTDTAKIVHLLDGNAGEWPAEKMETDKDTQIKFMADQDAGNLYMVLKISDQRMQMKIMTTGMNMYLDKKGKRREGTGVEFPLKRESGGGFSGGGRNNGTPPPDPKEIREKLAANMIFMKTFGFDDQEDKTQLIGMPTGINIAFDWDESNALIIEYLVPFSIIAPPASLAGKPIGIGWKLNGSANPGGGQSFTSSTSLVGVPSGRGGAARTSSNIPGTNANFPSGGNSVPEQSIWTKFTVTF
ncbi:MAG: hypothetical protein RLZZ28_1594 [Bacteroidota bacterium]|jgi:hypothetical protein